MDSRSKTDGTVRITAEINNEIPSLKGDLDKFKGRIPLIEKDIEKKKAAIQHLNKQIDLLKELKTLDLEQLQMISQGGSNMQHTLHSFIKNWDKIRSGWLLKSYHIQFTHILIMHFRFCLSLWVRLEVPRYG